jgi:sensor histidine kinase YesM
MVCLIIRGQKKLIKAHYAREKQLAELKLRSIRNQMDPHFTFNTINAIAAAIYREDREVAYTYFSKFSKLIRSTMLYSDRISRSLEDEIDFTQRYLEIEKFRYREKFEYTVTVHPNVNLSIEVPRMIIETFAESAINNGLMHRQKDGLLLIEILQEKGILKAVFEDNGVGMLRSAEYNKEKAFRAARLMDEFLKIYNELNKTRIKYEMYDLDVKQEFPGTRVVVKIPVAGKYLRAEN